MSAAIEEVKEIEALLDASRRLAYSFKNSALYRDYLYYKKELEAEPALLERVLAFKKSRFELESKRLQEGHVSFEEERRVAHQYTDLSLNSVSNAFLLCEYKLLKLYEQAFDILSEACEIN